MTKLIFSNPSEIDVRLITTFGVNVKPGPSAIGHFGTGLKYAIAVALRHGCTVDIFSGAAYYHFYSKPESIRGSDFNVVYMYEAAFDQVTPLAFTTKLGSDWLPWMAYREFWANAKDEGGDVRACPDDDYKAVAQSGVTQVVISGDALAEVHANATDYFLFDQPLHTLPSVELHPPSASIICYQGIRMLDKAHGQSSALFTYNLTTEHRLTEDRTLADSYTAISTIGQALLQSNDMPLLRQVLGARGDLFEAHLDFDWTSITPSQAFIDVGFEELRKRNGLSESTKAVLKRRYSIDVDMIETELVIADDLAEMTRLAPEDGEEPKRDYGRYRYETELENQLKLAIASAKYWRACAEKLGAEPKP